VERGKSLSRGQRTVAGISAVLLLAGGVAGYQVGVRAKRPPHFARGGKFLATAPSSPSPGTGLAPSTVPATTALPTTVGARSLAAQPPTTARTTTMPPTSLPAPAGAAAPAPEPASGLPQLGTYTYQVTGTESATGFGSRDFPKTATVVAHRDDGLPASQVVFDLTYSSDHTERAIAAYDGDGVSFVYEAGQVRFGPMAQTNQGDYQPAMTQVPLPLTAGVKRSGDTKVTDSGGAAERSESWTATVTGQDTVIVAGAAVATRVVRLERTSDPGSSQTVHRVRTYWYDPARRLWVKYTEQMHGEQHYGGVAMTYDDNLTATLSGYQPAA